MRTGSSKPLLLIFVPRAWSPSNVGRALLQKQTGTYMEITFIADRPSQTTVRVTAYEGKRYKRLKTEPWSTANVNEVQSQAEAAKLKQELGG